MIEGDVAADNEESSSGFSSEEDYSDDELEDDDFHMLALGDVGKSMFPRALARRYFSSLEAANSPTMVDTIDRTWLKAGVPTDALQAWVVRCCYGAGEVALLIPNRRPSLYCLIGPSCYSFYFIQSFYS